MNTPRSQNIRCAAVERPLAADGAWCDSRSAHEVRARFMTSSDIRQFIESYVRAWERQDVESFVACYAPMR